jgi:hypothetical protein
MGVFFFTSLRWYNHLAPDGSTHILVSPEAP